MTEKARAIPLKRTPKQEKALLGAEETAATEKAQTAAQAAAMRTAQIANLLIAGHSIESVAASLGSTPEEVERMLTADSARYIRTQPALRSWVRQYISGKYTTLLGAVWDQAVDVNHRDQLAYQDRARPLLDRLAKLHGADAPTQAEVKIDHTPESVQSIVNKIAASQGLGYDIDIFDDDDVVEADVVQDSLAAIEAAAAEADAPQPEDEENPL